MIFRQEVDSLAMVCRQEVTSRDPRNIKNLYTLLLPLTVLYTIVLSYTIS